MKIPLIINDEPVVLDAEPDDKMHELLRDANLFSVKCGCEAGKCGSCTILFDDKPVPSCLLPAALARDARIITLEHFMKSDDYQDIETGFRQADIKLCGFCDAGKIFGAYSILKKVQRPSRELIIQTLSHFPCKCTETESLVNGVLLAANARKKRLAGKKNGQK